MLRKAPPTCAHCACSQFYPHARLNYPPVVHTKSVNCSMEHRVVSPGMRGERMAMLCRRRARSLLCVSLILSLVLLTGFLYTAFSPTITESQSSGPPVANTGQIHRIRSKSCEIIDLALVVRGYGSCRDAALLIKSILLFRENPIRFHFLTDPKAKYILNTLLKTWHLYGVDYHFYDIDKRLVVQDKNGFYHDDANILFYDVLPHSVEKIIALKPTVLMSADIFHLWKMVHHMHKQGSVLSLVKVTSRSDEEFRTDVMLLDLKTMREKNWSKLWEKEYAKKSNSWTKSTLLSDLYKQHPNLFFLLNPGWNYRSNDVQPSTPCHEEQTVCARTSTGGSTLEKVLQEYDGNSLRLKHIGCETGPRFDQNALDYHANTSVYSPPCTDFMREGRLQRRTHPFYAGYSYDSTDPYDVTLLLHVTVDRLVSLLEPMCKHWEGPMSITIFMNDSEVSAFLDLISSSPIISSRQNIGYHIVYKEGTFMYYPINPLRIVALQNARTPYVFLNDMDFLPSFGLYSHLKETVKTLDLSHTVLVVPAFETLKDPKSFPFPRKKSALLKMIARNEVFQFHRDNFIRGHAPTDYSTWKQATRPYEIKWQPNYEPYLVVSVNITPLDMRFVGRNFNKESHTEELYYQRYKFYAVPDGFLLHLPHSPSSDAKTQKNNERHVECYLRRKAKWRAEKVLEYGYEPYMLRVYTLWNKLSSSYDTSL